MIKVLKRKFVLMTMLVLAALLFCVMAGINIFNYISLNSEADALLQEVISYYELGANPDPEAYGPATNGWNAIRELMEQQETADKQGESSEESEGDSMGEISADGLDESGFDINGGHESIFSFLLPDVKINDVIGAIFFYVVLDANGTPVFTDVSRVVNPTAGYANNMAISLFREKNTQGWMERCKYMAVPTESGGMVYVFLHRDRDIANTMRILLFSVMVYVVLLLIILVIIILISGRIVAPFAANVEKQKNFITNASHEIKTPLAIIQANAEALELYNGENKWTKNIRNQIERLGILVTNMITLARADEGVIPTERAEIDLSQETEKLIVMFQEKAAMDQKTIYRHLEPELVINGNRILILQLLSIVLENAVKYSLPGSIIEIHGFSRDRAIFLETVNRCEALPECEPERLFDRFYRPESSRYSDKAGNGIGLSAARSIIESYGGSITCSYEDPDKIRFVLTFRK